MMSNPIEQLSRAMQREALQKADLFARELPKVIKEGNVEGAALIAGETKRELHNYTLIDRTFAATITTLGQAGISLPSVNLVFESPTTKKKAGKKKEPSLTHPIPEAGMPSLKLSPENNSINLDGREYILLKNEWNLIQALKPNLNQWIETKSLTEALYGSSDKKSRQNLTQTLYEFRKRIGESAKEPRLIRTKPGRNAALMLTARIEETLPFETDIRLSPLDLNILSQSMQDEKIEDNLQLDDIQELKRIIDKSNVEVGEVEEELRNTARQDLLRRLKSTDLEALFNANESNGDAQFLLTILAGDDFHGKVKKLLNAS